MNKIKSKTLAIGIACCLMSISVTTAQRSFEINEVHYTQDFSSYAEGSTLQDNGWTLSGAGLMSIVTPGGSGQTLPHVVKFPAENASRSVALSPTISIAPGIELGDTIFLAAQVWRRNSPSSGVAIGLRNTEGEDLFFLRARDTSDDTFDLRGPENTWKASEEEFSRTVWYEILIAVELHATDITQSTGSLFYRELLNSDDTLIPVAGLQNINLGFDEETDPLDIAHIRLELVRNGVEFGNIRIGTGTIIPEPSRISMVFGGLVLTGVLLRQRLKRR